MRVARPMVPDKQETGVLEPIDQGRSLPARLVERANASELDITTEKAARWRKRYLDGGIDALEKDRSRPGRPRTITGACTAE